MANRYDDETMKFIETRKRVAHMRREEARRKRNIMIAIIAAVVFAVVGICREGTYIGVEGVDEVEALVGCGGGRVEGVLLLVYGVGFELLVCDKAFIVEFEHVVVMLYGGLLALLIAFVGVDAASYESEGGGGAGGFCGCGVLGGGGFLGEGIQLSLALGVDGLLP